MSKLSISHLEAIETVRCLNKDLLDAQAIAVTPAAKVYIDNLKSLLAQAQSLLSSATKP